MTRPLDEITLDEVETVGALARRLGIAHPSAINNWAKRYVDFPAAVATFGATEVWIAAEVVEWHRRFTAGQAGVTHRMAARMG